MTRIREDLAKTIEKTNNDKDDRLKNKVFSLVEDIEEGIHHKRLENYFPSFILM